MNANSDRKIAIEIDRWAQFSAIIPKHHKNSNDDDEIIAKMVLHFDKKNAIGGVGKKMKIMKLAKLTIHE